MITDVMGMLVASSIQTPVIDTTGHQGGAIDGKNLAVVPSDGWNSIFDDILDQFVNIQRRFVEEVEELGNLYNARTESLV